MHTGKGGMWVSGRVCVRGFTHDLVTPDSSVNFGLFVCVHEGILTCMCACENAFMFVCVHKGACTDEQMFECVDRQARLAQQNVFRQRRALQKCVHALCWTAMHIHTPVPPLHLLLGCFHSARLAPSKMHARTGRGVKGGDGESQTTAKCMGSDLQSLVTVRP